MKYSNLFIQTLKETPKDAEVLSHQLMARAGLIRKVASGIYSFTPIGLKIIRKFESIVREEMNIIGGQEVLLPSMIPAELWQKSGRWEKYGRELLRIKDRHGKEFCYGPTHEEVITDLVKAFVRSYKQLPIHLYQIQTKFRDEIRPRFGLMRGREFIMKDAYSFHATWDELDLTYTEVQKAYHAIFKRCGIEVKMVKADSGAIGGDCSAEFMVCAETGEDGIVECPQCEYAANLEAAETLPEAPLDTSDSSPAFLSIPTPGKKSVQDVADFLTLSPQNIIKTLIYIADQIPIAVLIRGDHELNEIKLKNELKCETLKLADEKTVASFSPVGFIGPIGLSIPYLADFAIQSITTGVIGANQIDTHYINILASRDLSPQKYADLRNATTGDPCPLCAQKGLTHPIRHVRGIEVGHIFKLGTVYSESLEATVLDAEGKANPIIMGCYGIGIGRTIAATIEQRAVNGTMCWPLALAPFTVSLIVAQIDNPTLSTVTDSLYQILKTEKIDTLYDDRTDSIGTKFKDHELLGIPLQLIVGKTFLNTQKIECKNRLTGETHTCILDAVLPTIKEWIYGS